MSAGGRSFYSDFDNEFDCDVWGVKVTSFIQEQPRLFREALAKLERILDGKEDMGTGALIAPCDVMEIPETDKQED